MFTSRAEFRLHLRIDNADERLTPIGRKIGLVTEERWNRFREKQDQKAALVQFLNGTRVTPERFGSLGLAADDRPTLAEWLRRPEASLSLLKDLPGDPSQGVLDTVQTELKYSGYVTQQQRQVERLKDAERRKIPVEFSYEGIPGLSNEVLEKLVRVRPETLGQAGRIPGVTPAAIAVLDVYLSLTR
jgi:tRNA uridine 5-carboxymethylaminomethyl modification enzyme